MFLWCRLRSRRLNQRNLQTQDLIYTIGNLREGVIAVVLMVDLMILMVVLVVVTVLLIGHMEEFQVGLGITVHMEGVVQLNLAVAMVVTTVVIMAVIMLVIGV